MTLELQPLLARALNGAYLNEVEAEAAVSTIMRGEASEVQIAALLSALRVRGETTAELVGAARAMLRHASLVPHELSGVIDTCGTGGDGAHTFNISTAVAFVAAEAGIPVAKHGNRAVSSSVGSADVLEALGVHIDLHLEEQVSCLRELNICFMFAQRHHSALRYAAPVRRALGVRTMFNLLGPITNPARPDYQLLGIFDGKRLRQIAEVLGQLGLKRALVVHGAEGLDELTLEGESQVALLDHGQITEFTIQPQGLVTPAPLSALVGGDAAVNAAMVREALSGGDNPRSEVVALNAGAALWVAERADSLADGVAKARTILASQKALARLDALIAKTRGYARDRLIA